MTNPESNGPRDEFVKQRGRTGISRRVGTNATRKTAAVVGIGFAPKKSKEALEREKAESKKKKK